MPNQKICQKCGKNIKQEFDFCPYCGGSLDNNNNWGMLGKNDAFSQNSDPFSGFLGGFNGGIFNKMLGNAMKILEKELQKEMKNPKEIQPKTNVQLYINGKKINFGVAKPTKKKKEKRTIREKPSIYFSKETLKKFTNLPRIQPKTNVRRLSDRIIYEIKMPGVKSIKDISIVKFENSIEIKAIGKSESYYKVIQVRLPMIDYYISKENLILELEAKS